MYEGSERVEARMPAHRRAACPMRCQEITPTAEEITPTADRTLHPDP
jgi:hypothetical protein